MWKRVCARACVHAEGAVTSSEKASRRGHGWRQSDVQGERGGKELQTPQSPALPGQNAVLFTSSNLSKKPVKPKNKVSAHALLNVYVQEHESPYTSPYTQLWRDVCVYTNDRNRQRAGGERFRPPSYPFLRCM